VVRSYAVILRPKMRAPVLTILLTGRAGPVAMRGLHGRSGTSRRPCSPVLMTRLTHLDLVTS
jgi:hypothetical protein